MMHGQKNIKLLIYLLLSNQKLVCTTHFQSFLVCLNPPKGILNRSKVEKQWHFLVASNRKSYKNNLKVNNDNSVKKI